jgi:hypothetical protein
VILLQQPLKYELVFNRKTTNALDSAIPLTRARCGRFAVTRSGTLRAKMRWYEFITLLGGAAAAWPFAAQAQQGAERAPRGDVLAGAGTDSDSQAQARIGAFREGLAARKGGLTTHGVRFSH